MATASGPSAAADGRVRWRRVLLWVLLAVLGIIALTHVVGGATMAWAGSGIGVLALVGGWLVINPWLHRHRYPGGKPERKTRSRTQGSLNYPGQRGRGLRQPFRSPGSRGRRSSGALFRRGNGTGQRRRGTGGSGTLGRRRRPAGSSAVSTKRRGGTGLARRRSGTFRRTSGSPGRRSGTSGRRSGASRRFSPFRAHSRPFRPHSRSLPGSRRKAAGRRTGAGTGSRRRFRPLAGRRASPGGGPSGRTRAGRRRFTPFRRRSRAGGGTGSGSTSRRRFSPFRRRSRTGSGGCRHATPGGSTSRRRISPFRRRSRTGSGGRPRPVRTRRSRGGWHWPLPFARRRAGGRRHAPRPAPRMTGSRHWRRPSTWFRRPPARRQAAGKPRSRRSPGRFRRAWWRLAGSPGSRGGRAPGPLRYAWWRLRGSPGMGGTRGTRRRAMRARYRNWRARLRANPHLPRHRPWHAPWRILPGGRMSARHRIAAWRTRWARFRWSRGWRARLVLPRDARGRLLNRRQRLARRWRIWRGRAPGIIRLRRQVPLRRRVMARVARLRPRNWRWPGRRRRRPPRSWADRFAPGGLAHWLAMRADRYRYGRWHRRHGRGTPRTAPGTRRPGDPVPGRRGTPNGSGTGPGRTAGGRPVSTQVENAADEVAQLGAWDPEGPADLHETIASLDTVANSVASAYEQVAATLEDYGVNSGFSETLREQIGSIRSASASLHETAGSGLMERAGGGDGASSPQVRSVVDTIGDLGHWNPSDPDELHNTIRELSVISDSVGTSYQQLSDTISGTGAHESYPPALDEAAEVMSAAGRELESAFSEGVMRNPRRGGG